MIPFAQPAAPGPLAGPVPTMGELQQVSSYFNFHLQMNNTTPGSYSINAIEQWRNYYNYLLALLANPQLNAQNAALTAQLNAQNAALTQQMNAQNAAVLGQMNNQNALVAGQLAALTLTTNNMNVTLNGLTGMLVRMENRSLATQNYNNRNMPNPPLVMLIGVNMAPVPHPVNDVLGLNGLTFAQVTANLTHLGVVPAGAEAARRIQFRDTLLGL